ncbi:MAG: ATP-binding cassette domain-containing protein [Actinomycetia bacterium]|nr:ATP-binding cassette domain-containing protein [Actinomycetes bacterium]
MSGDAILEVHDLTVGYRGAGVGIDHISFDVPAQGAVVLLGANGAGKSSTLRGIGGIMASEPAVVRSGYVVFEGDRLDRLGPNARARRGISLVPEENKIFPKLTVRENLAVGGMIAGKRAKEHLERALDVFPDLREHLPRLGGLLSGGQRQMLGVAMALCSGAKLLIVDELTLGLSPMLVPVLVRQLKTLVDGGLPVLIADQNLLVARALANVVCQLEGGRLISSGPPATVLAQMAAGERGGAMGVAHVER